MSKIALTNKIVKVSISNLLSLRNVEIELNKLNVFVGPNASGKSNIVRALQLIVNTVRNGVPSLSGYKEFKDIAYGFDETSEINLKIELSIENRTIIYSLTLVADNYLEEAWIDNKEALLSNGKSGVMRVLTRHGDLKEYRKSGGMLSSNLYRGVYRSVLASLPHDAAKELHLLAYTLRNISIHSFTPERLRLRSGVSARPTLGYYGDNLARVLLHLYLENRKAFSSIENVIKSLIPEVEEIIPHIEGSEVEIWMRVKSLIEPLKSFNISDGTLRILAYVTTLYSGTSLAVFEEPENCVHPHLLETIVDLARKAPCQVIMTTHSPYLLDHVGINEVFVVEKPGTETMVKKLSSIEEVKAVRKILEEGGTLGEAWYSGIMGGVPESIK